MLELTRVLGWYRDCLFIVGGNDVDIAVDHRKLTADGYRTIREHLTRRGEPTCTLDDARPAK